MSDYAAFLASKARTAPATGIDAYARMHASLKPFQCDLTRWALKRGRAAIFAGTGLGKSRMQLSYAMHVVGKAKVDALVLAPLAVAQQTVGEGQKIGVNVTLCREPEDVRPGINITNYDRLHKFDTDRFGAVIADESSCIKSFDSHTLKTMLERFKATRFKLACTATPAPNDWTELGNHAEFLGVCTRTEMLSEFFCHDGGETQVWRLKGHARGAFWKWVASWAALVSHPRDLGYDDAGYDLPPLRVHEHLLPADAETAAKGGVLFVEEAAGLMERRQARKASIGPRVAACAEVILCQAMALARSESSIAPRGIEQTKAALTSIGEPTPPNAASGLASDTQMTRNTEQRVNASRSNGNASIPGRNSINDSAPSASQLMSTSPCLPPRVDFAPYAAIQNSSETIVSALTIATPRDACVASSAGVAISGSESSGTTRQDLGPPPTILSGPRWIAWCELNAEQDALAKALGDECVSIYGALDIDEKERRYELWASGQKRVLLTKSSMFGFGVNMQFCSHVVFVGVSDSWESYYQAVRRCWRFGQTNPVDVHIFASEVEGSVVANLKRKERDAEEMSRALSRETAAAVRAEVRGAVRETNVYDPQVAMSVPEWLKTEDVR
jgi:hypothetical protein